jgi:hypothetical protein
VQKLHRNSISGVNIAFVFESYFGRAPIVREGLHSSNRMCLVESDAAEKIVVMKQADPGLNLTTKRTRKRVFLDEMERVVPWGALVDLITPYAPEGRRGHPPFAVETLLRIHFMQQWFTLSDPAMEEALHDTALFRDFAACSKSISWHRRSWRLSTSC